MTTDERKAFLVQLAALAELFDREMSESQLQLYVAALEDLSLDGLTAAIQYAVRSCKWFPKPAELREFIRDSSPLCPRCPGGHGIHEGHKVKHYPAGPVCETCIADMPTPYGYLTAPPVKVRPWQRMLPERTEELSRHEVRELVFKTVGELPDIAEGIGDIGEPYRAKLSGEDLDKRRRELRAQYNEIAKGAPHA